MRYGVLADVHGNLPALRTAVEALRGTNVQRWLVAGDLVGYGPQPNECIEEIAALDPIAVAGNHDLIALGQLSEERCIPLAQESLRWTRGVLTADSRAWLQALPLRAEAPGGIVMAHGSLGDPEEYTVTRRQALPQLQEVERGGGRTLVLGHTHRPWAFASSSGRRSLRRPLELPAGEAILLNPGAVGQSREVRLRARALMIDTKAGIAEFLALPYDVDAAQLALRRAGLSERGLHLRPSLPGLARRALSRLRS